MSKIELRPGELWAVGAPLQPLDLPIDFIQWYIFTFHGEQISPQRLERAYKEYSIDSNNG